MASFTSHWGIGQVAVASDRGWRCHPGQHPENPPVWKTRAVHHPGVAVPTPVSPCPWKNGAVALDTHRRCTVTRGAVYTGSGGASSHSARSRPSPGGHRPRGGGAIGQGGGAPGQPVALGLPASHRHRGGGAPMVAPQAEFHLPFFSFLTTFANMLILQVFHHHVQVC
jgi:hypothetical protein